MSSCTRRQGDVSAELLQQQFALAFQSQAPALFLELADILPSEKQRSELLQAATKAGWTSDMSKIHVSFSDLIPHETCLLAQAGSRGAVSGLPERWPSACAIDKPVILLLIYPCPNKQRFSVHSTYLRAQAFCWPLPGNCLCYSTAQVMQAKVVGLLEQRPLESVGPLAGSNADWQPMDRSGVEAASSGLQDEKVSLLPL